MSLDDLFEGGSSKKGRRRQREESALEPEEDPFAAAIGPRRGVAGPAKSGLDELGSALSKGREQRSSAEQDFHAASDWGRFKPRR